MSARPLTEEEQREASRTRVVELVWKLKQLNSDETTDLISRLEAEAPDILLALRRNPEERA
jgi:hypothetical protein